MTTQQKLEQVYKTPEKDLKEQKRKCWWSGCNKTAHFELYGWRWCFKHWKLDYKYGSGIGLRRAIKWTKIINL